ncbi:hypothetical protein EAO76_38985, partial [Streptomyces sp. sk2.1]
MGRGRLRGGFRGGVGHHAPATPGDLLFHIRGERMDVCYQWAAQLFDRLGGAVK